MAFPSQEDKRKEWSVETDVSEEGLSVSPDIIGEEFPVLGSDTVDVAFSSDRRIASDTSVPFVRPEPVSASPSGTDPAAGNVTRSVGVDRKAREVHRVVLKEDNTSQPTGDSPVSGVPKVQRVDLRSEPEGKGLRTADLRKYLSAEVIAAMQELDSIGGETNKQESRPAGLNDVEVGTADPLTDPWVASADPVGLDGAEKLLPSTDFAAVPNQLPILEPASAPAETGKRPWWKKILRRK
jgi:hypothetical protein